MKVIALDLGEKWVGTAISDSSCSLSFPLKTVELKDLKEFIEKTISIEPVKTVVFGLPLTNRGNLGLQAKSTSKIIENLKKSLSKDLSEKLSWVEIDERYSSKGAKSILKERSLRIKDNKLKEHSIAAALILENFLNSQKN